MLDLDMLPETWSPPEGLLARHYRDRFPHHGLGRGFKVDKESIIGLIVALERFVGSNLDAEMEERRELLLRLAGWLKELRHCQVRAIKNARGRFPSLDIEIDIGALGSDAYAVSRALQRHDPPVHLSERLVAQGILVVESAGLRTGDETIVARALRAVLEGAAASAYALKNKGTM
jgi:L-seryl-tRNA(Ser) seleniumtransferase